MDFQPCKVLNTLQGYTVFSIKHDLKPARFSKPCRFWLREQSFGANFKIFLFLCQLILICDQLGYKYGKNIFCSACL